MHAPAKYDYIDAARGIAVISVVVIHAAQAVGPGRTWPVDHWILAAAAFGQAGVQLFFAASALTLALSAHARRADPAGWRGFAIRRIARIAPLYTTGIIAYTIGTWVAAHSGWHDPRFGEHTPAQVLLHATYLHSWVPWAYDEVVPGGWSIGTEMAFYAFFPLLFIGATRLDGWRILGAAALASVLVAGLSTWAAGRWGWQVRPNDWWWCSLPAQLPVFLGGLALWRIQRDGSPGKRRAILVLGLGAALATPLLWRIAWRQVDTPGPTLAAMLLPLCCGAVACAVIEVLRSRPAFPRWLLSVGRASYSIYLVHFIAAWGLAGWLDQWLSGQLPGVVRLAMYATGSLAFAWLVAQGTMRLIERPGIHAGERLIARWWPEPA